MLREGARTQEPRELWDVLGWAQGQHCWLGDGGEFLMQDVGQVSVCRSEALARLRCGCQGEATVAVWEGSSWGAPTLCTSLATGQDSAIPIRNTHTGQVRGSLVHVEGTDAGVHTFLGIPFAKPPLGPLRFAPPEPAEAWSGVRDGTSHPAM